MVSKIEELNNYALTSASLGNIFHVIDYIEKGANNFNDIAKIAAKYGYNNILKLALDKGANNFKEISLYAAKFCRCSTIAYLKYLDLFDEDCEELYNKSLKLRDNAILWQLDNKIYTPQEIANNAALRGDIDVVFKMVELGATDLLTIAMNGANSGYIDIVYWIKDKGLNEDDINKVKECAIKTQHYHINELLTA